MVREEKLTEYLNDAKYDSCVIDILDEKMFCIWICIKLKVIKINKQKDDETLKQKQKKIN